MTNENMLKTNCTNNKIKKKKKKKPDCSHEWPGFSVKQKLNMKTVIFSPKQH